MQKETTQEVLRSKDEGAIMGLLNAMCVTIARDIDVFIHAQARYKKIRGIEEAYLTERIDSMQEVLLLLALTKANIGIITKSPL